LVDSWSAGATPGDTLGMEQLAGGPSLKQVVGQVDV
jgi:hypothetical protein